ncbi:hypothetical protein [Nocardioides sp. zg-DK7169]|uniref:hypothetical protein n=1 Tax=Nocardioides sp. zg-DK7169 TaxID=2736600 RepID=UPI001553E831|nr:hypothetical protein [Nocardioides sp. zg-DK7169]NPC97133.1 hypothetical protein [Nocardioides sp. zg-DK7169]
MSRRSLATAALLVASLGVLSACSEEEPAAETAPDATAAHGGADTSEEASERPEAWNPCDGLRVGRLEAVLGTGLKVDRGTEDAPRCALVPPKEGSAVLDANYMVFPDGLDAAWETMGAPEDGDVTAPRIPGADAARVVVAADKTGVAATGFVQNGTLIHVVNVADTAPYDRDAVVEGATTAMTQLSNASARAAELQAP